MPTTVSTHSCDLCGRAHPTLEAALRCEAQGVPATTLAVGDFVTAGHGVYGWWGEDRSWCLTTDRNAEKDDHLGPGNNRAGRGYKPTWRQDPGDGSAATPASGLWFREIWRIAAVGVADHQWGGGAHRLRIILWNPRHPNRRKGTEALVLTFDRGHHGPEVIGPEFAPPTLTPWELARFEELLRLDPASLDAIPLL